MYVLADNLHGLISLVKHMRGQRRNVFYKRIYAHRVGNCPLLFVDVHNATTVFNRNVVFHRVMCAVTVCALRGYDVFRIE